MDKKIKAYWTYWEPGNYMYESSQVFEINKHFYTVAQSGILQIIGVVKSQLFNSFEESEKSRLAKRQEKADEEELNAFKARFIQNLLDLKLKPSHLEVTYVGDNRARLQITDVETFINEAFKTTN